jgi:hypothetical protein
MNKYGARLMRQWQRTDPERFAKIQDPEEFFAQLGADLVRTGSTRWRGRWRDRTSRGRAIWTRWRG